MSPATSGPAPKPAMVVIEATSGACRGPPGSICSRPVVPAVVIMPEAMPIKVRPRLKATTPPAIADTPRPSSTMTSAARSTATGPT